MAGTLKEDEKLSYSKSTLWISAQTFKWDSFNIYHNYIIILKRNLWITRLNTLILGNAADSDEVS